MEGDSSEHVSESKNARLPYSSLTGAHEIRLLEVYSARDRNSCIRCGLLNYTLSESNDYEALSYTWSKPIPGKPFLSQKIICNNVEFFVTQNLEAALKTLRLPDRSRIIWIDQICINQGEVAERNRQVAIMDEIYARATQTVVWLGDVAYGSDQAMDFVHFLAVKMGEYTLQNPTKKLSKKAFGKYGIPERSNSCWAQLQALLEGAGRSYWTRVWILQELGEARKITVYCGDRSVEWMHFAVLFELFQKHSDFYVEIEDLSVFLWERTMGLIHTYSRNKSVIGGLYLGAPSKGSHGILDLLWRTYYHNASEPVDKIYGLLGFFKPRLDMVPDYTLSLSTVLRDVTRGIIESSSSLMVLGIVNIRPTILDLPSWVPNWSQSGTSRNYYSDMSLASKHEADKRSLSTYIWGDDPNLLNVSATFLDEVGNNPDDKSNYFEAKFRDMDTAAYKEFMAMIADLTLSALKIARRGLAHLGQKVATETFWRTMMLNTDMKGEFISENPSTDSFQQFKKRYEALETVMYWKEVGPPSEFTSYRSKIKYITYKIRERHYQLTFSKFCNQQIGNESRYFLLTEAKRVGWGP